jgi:hypothetical protein
MVVKMKNWIKGHPPRNSFSQAWWVWDGENIFLACWIYTNAWEIAEPTHLDFRPENVSHYMALSRPDKPVYLRKDDA